MRIEKWKGGRNWAVYNGAGELVCVTVYKQGELAVLRLLEGLR